MHIQPAEVSSEGLRLSGNLFLPEEPAGLAPQLPLVVACSGFMGLERIHPRRFGRALTARGYPVFGFDYRGFGASEGEPGRVLLDEQVIDIANAVHAARSLPQAQGRPAVLLGWGMGGGLVLDAAHVVPGLAGLICINGLYNGVRAQLTLRGEDGYRRFLRDLDGWAGEGENAAVDPFWIYPLDDETREYVDDYLRPVSGFGGEVRAALASSLLRLKADTDLDDLVQLPLLVAHGRDNRLHPPQEAEELLARYPGPSEACWLPGGHTEWMADDHPTFLALMETVDGWLQRNVVNA